MPFNKIQKYVTSRLCYCSHVFCILAETRVIPPIKLNSELNLLHESQAGTIYSPQTLLLLLIICAPNVAELLQPEIQHLAGQDLPEP